MKDSGPRIDPIAHESLLDALGVEESDSNLKETTTSSSDMDLATFLIHRACNNSTLANYFCW